MCSEISDLRVIPSGAVTFPSRWMVVMAADRVTRLSRYCYSETTCIFLDNMNKMRQSIYSVYQSYRYPILGNSLISSNSRGQGLAEHSNGLDPNGNASSA